MKYYKIWYGVRYNFTYNMIYKTCECVSLNDKEDIKKLGEEKLRQLYYDQTFYFFYKDFLKRAFYEFEEITKEQFIKAGGKYVSDL